MPPKKKLLLVLYAALLGVSAVFGVLLAAGCVGATGKDSDHELEERNAPAATIVHRTNRDRLLSDWRKVQDINLGESGALQSGETNALMSGVSRRDEIGNGSASFAPSVRNTMKNTQESEFQRECFWVNRTKSQPPYFLTAVLLLRIYKEDKAKLTTRELKQWLQYMRYIGVEHVYLYDAFYSPEEAQVGHLEQFLRDKYVTYIDWHMHNPYTISGTQVSAYQHCIDNYGSESTWQMAVDIDEYPFVPLDQQPDSVVRFIRSFSSKNPRVSEISMQNFLFLGKPLDQELLMERLWRRNPKPSNALVKPIYQPANVRASIHHNSILRGTSSNAPYEELRMNHYWGARLQNWGEDTPEILAQTIEDRSMETVTKQFHKCELYIRPYIS